jgi:hypothetical protein
VRLLLRLRQSRRLTSSLADKPPPCNSFYLRGACFAESCKYGHMYTLRPGDKERMAAACKTQMCISVEKGA